MPSNTLKYTNARLMAVQAVYAHAQSDEDWNKLISRFLLEEVGGSVIEGDGKAEKYVALEKTERKYIEVLRGEVVPIVEHIEKPCVAVEHLVEKDLWPSESRDYYNHVDNAVVYSKLAKSGCPEKSEVYRKKIQYELQIALGLSDGVKPECQWTGKMMEIFVNTKSLSQAKIYLERCADGFSPESLDWWRENIDTIIK